MSDTTIDETNTAVNRRQSHDHQSHSLMPSFLRSLTKRIERSSRLPVESSSSGTVIDVNNHNRPSNIIDARIVLFNQNLIEEAPMTTVSTYAHSSSTPPPPTVDATTFTNVYAIGFDCNETTTTSLPLPKVTNQCKSPMHCFSEIDIDDL